MSNEEKDQDAQKEEESSLEDEHKRLGGYAPLTTITRLCPGPLISQITSSLYGLVDSMWVSRFIGEIGLTAMSAAYVIENSVLAFGYFVSTGASTKISYLFSKNNYDSANQVVADLMRVCLIMGILLPAILLPSAKPIIRWLDAGDNIVDMSFHYLIPPLACSFISTTYLLSCGVLQAEGRTWAYAMAQTFSLVSNMILFDPLLLYLIKKVFAATIATALTNGLPGIVIVTLLFLHKLTCKPTGRMFFKKFDKESYGALLTGISALIMNLSTTIPSIFLQKFIAIAANKIGAYETVMALWNANVRLYTLSLCVSMALNTAYLPAASYAFGKKKYGRILGLTFHVAWISLVWGALVTFIVCAFPKAVGRIWSTSDDFLYWAGEILPVCFYTIMLCSMKFIMISFLQATQRNFLASVTSISTELLPLPIFACIFHYTGNKDSPKRIFYSYVCNDIFSFLVCCCATVPSMIRFYKESKLEKNDDDFDDDPAIAIPEL